MPIITCLKKPNNPHSIISNYNLHPSNLKKMDSINLRKYQTIDEIVKNQVCKQKSAKQYYDLEFKTDKKYEKFDQIIANDQFYEPKINPAFDTKLDQSISDYSNDDNLSDILGNDSLYKSISPICSPLFKHPHDSLIKQHNESFLKGLNMNKDCDEQKFIKPRNKDHDLISKSNQIELQSTPFITLSEINMNPAVVYNGLDNMKNSFYLMKNKINDDLHNDKDKNYYSNTLINTNELKIKITPKLNNLCINCENQFDCKTKQTNIDGLCNVRSSQFIEDDDHVTSISQIKQVENTRSYVSDSINSDYTYETRTIEGYFKNNYEEYKCAIQQHVENSQNLYLKHSESIPKNVFSPLTTSNLAIHNLNYNNNCNKNPYV